MDNTKPGAPVRGPIVEVVLEGHPGYRGTVRATKTKALGLAMAIHRREGKEVAIQGLWAPRGEFGQKLLEAIGIKALG